MKSLIRRYRHIRQINREVFGDSIPIKIVFRLKNGAPAEYWCDAENVGDSINKEYYKIAIFTRKGNDFSRAVHEIRHRVQCKHPDVRLFDEKKLNLITDKRIPQILAYLEKLGEISIREKDAVIIEKIIEYSENGDKLRSAKIWLKQGANRVF